MYHLLFGLLLLAGIVLSFIYTDERFFNEDPLGYKLQFGMMGVLLLLMPIIYLRTASVRAIKVISIPAILTFLTVQVPEIRSFFDNVIGVKLNTSDLSVQDFFKTKFGFFVSLSIFLLYFCLNQIIVLPLTSLSKTVPDIINGQFLPVGKIDVPRVIFMLVTFIATPLFISGKLSSLVARLASNSSPDSVSNYKSAVRVLSTLLGFLISYNVVHSITPIEIVGSLVTVVVLFSSGLLKKVFSVLKIDIPYQSAKQVFTNDETLLLFATVYGVLLLLSSTVFPLVPGLSFVRSIFLGSSVHQLLTFAIQLVLFWMVPSLTGKSFQASLAKSVGDASKVETLNGYALGYIVGYVLALSGYIFISHKYGLVTKKI